MIQFLGEIFFRLFLEESFAALIGIIFVYEAFDKMLDINKHRPVRFHTTNMLPTNCSCVPFNRTQTPNSTKTINVISMKYYLYLNSFSCILGLL